MKPYLAVDPSPKQTKQHSAPVGNFRAATPAHDEKGEEILSDEEERGLLDFDKEEGDLLDKEEGTFSNEKKEKKEKLS